MPRPFAKGNTPHNKGKRGPRGQYKKTQDLRAIITAFNVDAWAEARQLWKKLCKQSPGRALKLLDSLSSYSIARLQAIAIQEMPPGLPPPVISIDFDDGGPGRPWPEDRPAPVLFVGESAARAEPEPVVERPAPAERHEPVGEEQTPTTAVALPDWANLGRSGAAPAAGMVDSREVKAARSALRKAELRQAIAYCSDKERTQKLDAFYREELRDKYR